MSQKSFIACICEQPEDDTSRLVFADWLQENGDPDRAEFIRDQIEWRAGSRDFDLLDANWDRWFPDVMRHDEQGFRRLQNYGGGLAVPLFNGNTMIFTRGFVSAVWFSRTPSYFKHADEGYWRQQPVTSVRLVDAMVFPSGGNDTFYLANLGRFPSKYWASLDNLPSTTAVLNAVSTVCVSHGRAMAGLPEISNTKTPPAQVP